MRLKLLSKAVFLATIMLILLSFLISGASGPVHAEPVKELPVPGRPAHEITTDSAETIQLGNGICIIPTLGIDHYAREEESPLRALTTHDVKARAGWKLSLMDNVGLSAAATLPVVSAAQNKEALNAGERNIASTLVKSELSGALLQNLGLRSELHLKLGERLNMNLYYDYTKVNDAGSRQMFQDERIGTKLEYHFK